MKRWHYYIFIGLIFGVFDWFFLDWLSSGLGPNLGENPFIVIPIIITLNYGIWLVPIIPVAFYETQKANHNKGPILAGILTWCCALFSYYTYYTILLSLGKLPNLAHLNLFGKRYDSFWGEYGRMFMRIIFWQFIEWIPVAVIGGSIIGAFSWWMIKKPKKRTETGQTQIERN